MTALSDRSPVDEHDTATTGEVVIDGRYRVVDRIGAGLHAQTYRAVDSRLCRNVAVKIFDSGTVDLEHAPHLFSTMASVCEPGIARVLDAGVDLEIDGSRRAYVVSELIRGTALAEPVEHLPLAPARIAAIGAVVARSLAALHGLGVAHGHVGPGNVLLVDALDTRRPGPRPVQRPAQRSAERPAARRRRAERSMTTVRLDVGARSMHVPPTRLRSAERLPSVARAGNGAVTDALTTTLQSPDPDVVLTDFGIARLLGASNRDSASDVRDLGRLLLAAATGRPVVGDRTVQAGLDHLERATRLRGRRRRALGVLLTAMLDTEPHARPHAGAVADELAAIADGTATGRAHTESVREPDAVPWEIVFEL